MRVTRKVYSLYRVMAGKGWMTAPDLANAMGEPRQNLDHSIKQMVDGGLVERRATLRPICYRIVETIPTETMGVLTGAAEVYEKDRA